jgi:hypothetical protein
MRDAAMGLAKNHIHPFSRHFACVFAALLAIDLGEHDGFLEVVGEGFMRDGGRERTRMIEVNVRGFRGYAEVLTGRADRGIAGIRAALEDAGARNLAPVWSRSAPRADRRLRRRRGRSAGTCGDGRGPAGGRDEAVGGRAPAAPGRVPRRPRPTSAPTGGGAGTSVRGGPEPRGPRAAAAGRAHAQTAARRRPKRFRNGRRFRLAA